MASNDKLENRLKSIDLHTDTSRKLKKTHKERDFDFSKYSKRRIAFKFLYLGWNYQGFAAQDNTSNTIEEELFAALKKSRLIEDRSSVNYSRCGRTDKGVSAFGQVIALDVRSNVPSGDAINNLNDKEVSCDQTNDVEKKKETIKRELPYVQILNRLLPHDIRVLAYAPVDESFDARFSCKTRMYKYYFPASNLDIDLMHESAQK